MTTEKIEAFWSDATADDVARVMKGETVEARFRDFEGVKWVQNGCSLAGGGAGMWASSSGLRWGFCQVYREPSWWLERPDPGPEWRLLGKFPDEELKEHDEWWNGSCWSVSFRFTSGPQSERVWYRRRIEPVEADRGIALSVGDVVHHPNGLRSTLTEKGFEVTQ